ncbi:DUF3307 domain-containing protein [Enterovirga aerilata]|uniref:DUF3307 domain-containing protein n=1 Tax=Enterovirga aerilata TaxID=2730920 RepID=A0A849I5E2_9HYPH|nr:DUF3307 domain-containing protein [Enterovirga sp. DB1703]NNM75076.1 DUF3307 domain-containing protein [Enterovirga sp. DB1703]
MDLVATLALLLVGHALADYPLQGDWLSKAKNHTLSLVPGEAIWPGALACHAAIHGGAVGLATGSVVLGAAEAIMHAGIDYAKCAGRISYNLDQSLHIACKLVWVSVLILDGPLP